MSNDDKRLTKSAAEIIMAAQVEIAENQQAEEKIRRIELIFAEWFGFDGRGGKLENIERMQLSHAKHIAELKLFKAKVVMIGSFLATAAGALSAVIAKLIEKLL